MNWIKGKLLTWIIARLKEPSTWKSIFGMIGLGGYWIAPEFLEYIATGTGVAIAAAEFIRKEAANGTQAEDKQGTVAVDSVRDANIDLP